MTAATPLLMHIGMPEDRGDACREPDITADERLPYIVEVKDGAVAHRETRLTEVKRETTDDN